MERILNRIVKIEILGIGVLAFISLLSFMKDHDGRMGYFTALAALFGLVYLRGGNLTGRGEGTSVRNDFAERKDEANPLYCRGALRKVAEKDRKSTVFSPIRGIYWCQIYGIVQTAGVLLTGVIISFFPFPYKETLINGAMIWIAVGTAVLLCVRGYYDTIILRDIGYFNKWSKIWRPYCFGMDLVCRASTFHCQYRNFMELKKILFSACKASGYALRLRDSLGQGGTIWTFMRQADSSVEIFQVLYAEEFRRSHMEKANSFFGDLYGKLAAVEKDANVRLTFLLCVDRPNLIYKRLAAQNTFQKKERILLPAGICFSQKMLSVGNRFVGKCGEQEEKIMKNMEEELREILGLEDVI